MSQTVSPIKICYLAGYAALNAYAGGGSAISPAALEVRKAATDIVASAERSQVLFGEKAYAISQLWALANECAKQGWDGSEANPLALLAVRNAENFVRALPSDIPLPEFAPEPDGSVSMDWIQSRNRLFSLSVGTNNRLAYAWLDGTDNGHAVAFFDGEKIPHLILEGIKGITLHGNTALRVA
jgi:hypothetical protein